MKICGIVAEYNPFHNGHLYQINKVRSRGYSHVIAIMTGHVVQRGDIACFSKWARTKAALRNGVDLVLELPALYSLSSAENFAYGSIKILNELSVVEGLCFGSEEQNIEKLLRCADACIRLSGSDEIKALLSQGMSYPAAREQIIRRHYSQKVSDLLRAPNNILAVEYLKAIKILQSSIKPVVLLRKGAEHDGILPLKSIASASYLRKMLTQSFDGLQEYVPGSAFRTYADEIKTGLGPVFVNSIEQVLLYALKSASLKDFMSLRDVTEGLENRLFRAAKEAISMESFYQLAKTKRYTLSRIRRIVFSLLLKNTKEIDSRNPPYVRILGANQRGEEVLYKIKKKSKIPLYSSFAKIARTFPDFAQIDERATDLFSLAQPDVQKSGQDYYQSFIRI